MKKTLARILIVMVAALMLSAPLTAQAKELTGELEIFSWWAGDEGPALQALIDIYKKQNPGVKVINATVTGGSGVNAKAVLKTRMLGGEPPDSFQVHAGQELIGTWVKADRMVDLTPLFKEMGWMDVFPEGLVKLIGTDKGIWSVPVNIHRSNVMWYVPANLEKWGVKAPGSWDEFFTAAEKLKAEGVLPLALAQNWTANHLFESVALASLGADNWDALWSGKLKFDSPEGVKAWELFGKVLGYTNADASSAPSFSSRLTDGEAAMSEPVTVNPMLMSTSAIPFMPEPPMPTMWILFTRERMAGQDSPPMFRNGPCAAAIITPQPYAAMASRPAAISVAANSFAKERAAFFMSFNRSGFPSSSRAVAASPSPVRSS